MQGRHQPFGDLGGHAPAEAPIASGFAKGAASELARLGCPQTQAIPRKAPARLAATASRQRRERSRPSGSSSNGRVTPRLMAGAQTWPRPPQVAASWARQQQRADDGRQPGNSTQGVPGICSDQTSPAAPIQPADARAGRRSPSTRPMVARPSGKAQHVARGDFWPVRPGRERPGEDRSDHQANNQAAGQGGQEQRPGQHGPGPRVQRHGPVLGSGGACIGRGRPGWRPGLAAACPAGGTGPLRSARGRGGRIR